MPIPYYPAVRYHRTLGSRVVQTPDEWAALGPEWVTHPSGIEPVTVPAVTVTEESVMPETDPAFVGPPVSAATEPVKRKRGRPRKESYGG